MTMMMAKRAGIATNQTIVRHEDAITRGLNLWDDRVDPILLEGITGTIVHPQGDVVGHTLHRKHELITAIPLPDGHIRTQEISRHLGNLRLPRPIHERDRHRQSEAQFPPSNGESSRPAKGGGRRVRKYCDSHEVAEPQVQVENYWGGIGDEAEVEIDPTVGAPTFTRRPAYNLDIHEAGPSKQKKYRFVHGSGNDLKGFGRDCKDVISELEMREKSRNYLKNTYQSARPLVHVVQNALGVVDAMPSKRKFVQYAQMSGNDVAQCIGWLWLGVKPAQKVRGKVAISADVLVEVL
ncbi:hypothetical protein BDZ89DRAFT_1044238 [Hymenopellis radicata]|nr:hypothetical protein BDZ89DRAFT_1044238 [Hymenopellis radicata]